MTSENKAITNNICMTSEYNGQLIIFASTTYATENNSITAIGGAMGMPSNSQELNEMITTASNSSIQNMQLQVSHLQALQVVKQSELPIGKADYQDITIQQEKQPTTTKYTKPHSTTRAPSERQIELIRTICQEQGKDPSQYLAGCRSSADANNIIQKLRNKS